MMRPNILVVDDDRLVGHYIASCFKNDASVQIITEGTKAMDALRAEPFTLVFIDLDLGVVSGFDLIKETIAYDASIQVVVISSSQSLDDGIEAFRLGAHDFLKKPLKRKVLEHVFLNCVQQNNTVKKTRQLHANAKPRQCDQLIGQSSDLQKLKMQIQSLANTDIDVLIQGETGTGKELVARALYEQEDASQRPYITVNCAAIPAELMESELFGHERGAFTGAQQRQIGKFENAHGGDIFLDEIATLTPVLQAKLLRVLQEREIEPLGFGRSKKLKFRVIAATNEDLLQSSYQNTFRRDLYFRLNKIVLTIPPLRTRKTDIPLLASHFLEKHMRSQRLKTLDESAYDCLQAYDWPGNVRELENLIETLIVTTHQNVITAQDVSARLLPASYTIPYRDVATDHRPQSSPTEDHQGTGSDKGVEVFLPAGLTLRHVTELVQSRYAGHVVAQSKTKREAAEKLDIERKTLFRKLLLGAEKA